MKFKRYLSGSVAALCLAATCFGTAASAEGKKAEVIHWWTSASEAAAIKVFADRFKDAGGEWVDNGIAGDAAKRTFTNRLLGGNPPQVGQFNVTREFEEIVDAGLLNNLNAEAEAGNWAEVLPGIINNVIKRDGNYYAVPVNIHGSNWLWYNKAAFEKAGAKPPTDWDSFFAAVDKLKADGIVPIAVGGESWQERLTFNAVLLSVAGRDFYLKLFNNRDAELIKSEKMGEVIDVYTRLRDLVRETDKGSPGRSWNETTSMVITGKAAMQIMGDWAKGEFISAGQKAGVDYGCIPAVIPQSPYMISGDVFVFPKTGDDADREAQSLMVNVMLDKETQIAFNNVKGSIPVRSDVDPSKLDPCGAQAIKLTSSDATHVGSTGMYITPDLAGAIQDIYTEYWNASDMTKEDMVARLVETFETVN
ncbi:ABC transporter substrate-binding protein [Kiloniella majae]|uniref:ABC transporter substrate-binding protein n=1 Tax=Kiloniella majae TaxID=1938558 RepID=UPI000A279004|nr:ABC transporter substrate-binding protein [Kiloniella majae]